jgi:transglutaminase-like putative cysteine protease
MDYSADAPVVFLVNVRAQDHDCQRVVEETFNVTPALPTQLMECDITHNRFDQVRAEVPGVYHLFYEAVVEANLVKMGVDDLPPTTPGDFDLRVLPFLYPSRYSQSDRLGRIAADHFGSEPDPVKKVQAIVQWLAQNIAYISGTTDANTSCVDTLVERAGVCRDFAHLGIGLCRALNIPARYFTCYATAMEPPDFHACFETWIGGRWVLWDATRLASPDSVVRIGRGRDAADVSVCTSFGSLKLQRKVVICEEIEAQHTKMTEHELRTVLVCHGEDFVRTAA